MDRKGRKILAGKRVCPVCGREYAGYPALSRGDSAVEICPDCGMREALDAAGIIGQEADRIMRAGAPFYAGPGNKYLPRA